MTNIVVGKIPSVDLPIQEMSEQIICGLQKRFADQGYLRGLVLATLEQCVNQEMAINEEIFLTYIRDNWDTFFPGVEETEANIEQARVITSTCLRAKKDDIRSRLMEYLTGPDSQEERQRYHSLLISPDKLNTLLRKPCHGRPHDFVFNYFHQTKICAMVKTWLLHRERSRFKKHDCGNAYLYRACVELWPCSNCDVAQIAGSNIFHYCDYCGFQHQRASTNSPTWATIEAVIASDSRYRILSKKEVIKIG